MPNLTRALAALAAAGLILVSIGLTNASPIGVNPTGDASGEYVAISGTGSATAGEGCDYATPLPVQPPCQGLLALSLTGEARGGLVSVGGAQAMALAGACAADPASCAPEAGADGLVDDLQRLAGSEVDLAQRLADGHVESAQRLVNGEVDIAQSLGRTLLDATQHNADAVVDTSQATAAEVAADPTGVAGRVAGAAQQDVGTAAAEAASDAQEALAGAPADAEALAAAAQDIAAGLQATAQRTVDDAPATVDDALARAEGEVEGLPDECVQVDADASCESVAVSVMGDSRAKTFAVSGTGRATACQPELLCIAASGTGAAQGYFAVSGLGPAQACEPGTDYLCTAVSLGGPAQGDDYAVSVLGDAEGGDVAVSVLGQASGPIAIDGSL